MAVQTFATPSTFAASPEAFGLKRSASASPRTRSKHTMDPESLVNSFDAIGLNDSKTEAQLASGPNTIPLGSRGNQPPLKDVIKHLADASPVAALPFSITGNQSGSSAFAHNTIATHSIPTSAFITDPNAIVVPRSAFPPMQAGARAPAPTFVNPPLPSRPASAPTRQKPSIITSAFDCNPNAFAAGAAYNARISKFSFNNSPCTASASGLPSTWTAVTNLQDEEPMDVDDPYAMEICLPDPDAMDTSPNSENYTVPFFPYHGPEVFAAPQFGRLFHPFVPPPLPEPTHANAYNALRQLDSSTAAIHAPPARPELYSLPPRQPSSSALTESLLPRFSSPIMDELVERYPHSPDAILADKKRKRAIKTAANREFDDKRAHYLAARSAQLKAERKELRCQQVALAVQKPERPSRRLRTGYANFERVEVPPCMVPEKTRQTLGKMRRISPTKTDKSESSRRCNMAKVGRSLLAAACSAPRSLVVFL